MSYFYVFCQPFGRHLVSDANVDLFLILTSLAAKPFCFRNPAVWRSKLMILALISIACFSDISNSLQAMLICARISNAIGMDACLHDVNLDGFLALMTPNPANPMHFII